METKNIVKRKPAKKIRTPPVEVHWTQFEARSVPPGRQQEIADQLMEYVKQPDKYTIVGFMAEMNLSHALWYEWCAKYPIIKTANERAKRYLGAKRFDAAASKKGSEKLLYWAGQYDEDAYKYMKEMEELKSKKDEKSAASNIVINMTDFMSPDVTEAIIPETIN